MMMKVYEKAPAKINLLLDVIRKREDGYHEVEMIMTMVDLADRLEMYELPRDQIVLSSQAGFIPLDEKNLAFQAARLIKERCGVKRGVYIHLDKNIPVAAGLAGSGTIRRLCPGRESVQRNVVVRLAGLVGAGKCVVTV